MRSRWGSRLAAVALARASCALHAGGARADGQGFGPPAIVSVGDSIASGEGGRWAGNTGGLLSDGRWGAVDRLGLGAYWDDPSGSGELIAGCHRSAASEVHIGGGVVAANLACSSARTYTVSRDDPHSETPGYFKPGLDFYDVGDQQGQALMLRSYAATHNVKLVLVSIGGNDIGIRTILQACVSDFMTPRSAEPLLCSRGRLARIGFERLTSRIVHAIQRVHRAMLFAHYPDSTYTILVQDYPTMGPNGDFFRYPESIASRGNVGGCPFWNTDATWLNRVIGRLNADVHAAVRDAGLPNVALLRVADALRGHRLCQPDVGKLEEEGLTSWHDRFAMRRLEWVNQVHLSLWPAVSRYALEESLHPNYWGQLALRNCLRLAYNRGRVRGGVCTPTDPQTVLLKMGGPKMVLR